MIECHCRKATRAVQCNACKFILEEPAISDLVEYHATTQAEELHCVVTPDFLSTHIVDVSFSNLELFIFFTSDVSANMNIS